MAQAKVSDVKAYETRAFASTTTYITDDHKPEDVETENYFHTLSNRYLYVGDRIDVFSILEGSPEAPKSWAEAAFKVVGIDKFNTSVEMVSPWVNFTAGVSTKPKAAPKFDPEPKEAPKAKARASKKEE